MPKPDPSVVTLLPTLKQWEELCSRSPEKFKSRTNPTVQDVLAAYGLLLKRWGKNCHHGGEHLLCSLAEKYRTRMTRETFKTALRNAGRDEARFWRRFWKRGGLTGESLDADPVAANGAESDLTLGEQLPDSTAISEDRYCALELARDRNVPILRSQKLGHEQSKQRGRIVRDLEALAASSEEKAALTPLSQQFPFVEDADQDHAEMTELERKREQAAQRKRKHDTVKNMLGALHDEEVNVRSAS